LPTFQWFDDRTVQTRFSTLRKLAMSSQTPLAGMPQIQKPVDQSQAKTLNFETNIRFNSRSLTSIHDIQDCKTSAHLPATIEGKSDGTDFMVETGQGRCQRSIPRTFDPMR
jgi:hypothetical protein